MKVYIVVEYHVNGNCRGIECVCSSREEAENIADALDSRHSSFSYIVEDWEVE